jgi:hypothetical protein
MTESRVTGTRANLRQHQREAGLSNKQQAVITGALPHLMKHNIRWHGEMVARLRDVGRHLRNRRPPQMQLVNDWHADPDDQTER